MYVSTRRPAGLPTVGLAFASFASFASLCSAADSSVELEATDIRASHSGSYKTEQASSPKFTAPLVETAKSITVITEEMIKERGATTLVDVLRTTPGVTLGAGEGGTPLGDRPFIRGFEASTDTQIDGLRDLGRASRESFNLESVEILKGPSSAYTGRGSTGGSINLVSKTAKVQDFSALSLTMGTDSLWRTTVDLNRYQQEYDLAFRLNGMKHEADTPGRDEVTVKRWGIAPTVTWGLSGATRVTASYYHLQTDDMPDQGHPVSNISGKPAKVDRDNFYGLVHRDFRKTSADYATLIAEHSFSEAVTLRNSTRIGRTMQDYVMSRPVFTVAQENAGLVQSGGRSRNVVNRSLINQTDAFGELHTGWLQHNYSTGFELSREVITNRNKWNAPNGPLGDLYNPDPKRGGWTVTRGNNAIADRYQTDVASIYAFDTLKLHEQWDLALGLRYDDFEIKNRAGTQRSTANMWNYSAAVVFKPMPHSSVYLSYGTSSNPSGENTGSGGADGASAGNLGGNKAGLDPEKNRSLELGTKWDLFNQQLSLTAAVFRTEKTNARITDPVSGDVVLDGDTKVTGIDLGASGKLTDNWSVWAGYVYLDAKTVKTGGGSNDGNRAKFIAPNSGSIWTTYNLGDWTVGGGSNYMDSRYINDANTMSIDSYWRYDAMLGYKVSSNVDLQLNLLNLTDETIYDASHVGLFATVAPGRSAELTFNLRF